MSTREGGLGAPTRHAIAWRDDGFTDEAALDAEMRRVFDICHGCRRCFNLCDSFPRLFAAIDAAPTGEVDSVPSASFKGVVDACTLCDMCYMTKCPYVPPHPFNLDFPHLMLRYRAREFRAGRVGLVDRLLARTDVVGRLGTLTAPLANWATRTSNRLMRRVIAAIAGVDARAHLPRYAWRTLVARRPRATPVATPAAPTREAPAMATSLASVTLGRVAALGAARPGPNKAVLYATCLGNFNDPAIGAATRAVLARNGVECTVVHPHCCGMPLLELGDIAGVARAAEKVSAALLPFVEQGYDIVALVPSCALMLKREWPLILPESDAVRRLAAATHDVSEYVVKLDKAKGLAPGLKPLSGPVAMHLACHARAQNMGAKAAEMLRLIPDAAVNVIERCSGHGGAWGVKKGNFETALKLGRPVARQAARSPLVSSECPLAGAHIVQGIAMAGDGGPTRAYHPIELLAHAYGLPFGPQA